MVCSDPIIGLIGDTSRIDIDLIQSLDIVEDVKRISEPYKCANRNFHPDDTVIDVAKENALKNNVECEFEFGTSENIHRQFDLVLANILHNVLNEIMEDLQRITKKGGYLVLSGILEDKAPVVLDAIKRCKLEMEQELHQNQWVCFIVKNI